MRRRPCPLEGAVDEYEDEKTWVMVKDKRLAKSVNAKQNVEVRNRFEMLAVETNKDRKMTRTSAIEFNVAEVRKPLASAGMMVKSGNRVVLDQDGTFIENKSTGERMEVMVKDETFVFDVELTNGESEVITLDSGAGVPVWPRGRCEDVTMMPMKEGLRMCAANGTPITNLGRKLIKFRSTCGRGTGKDVGFCPAGLGPRAAHAEDDRVVRPLMPVEIGWGQEDQEDDEVNEPSEETRTPVKMNDPHAPSQKEREQHEMTHLPFRSWCWKCVFGRG